MTPEDRTEDIKEDCNNLRAKIKDIAGMVKELKEYEIFKGEEVHPADHGEMLANIMLAYRHLEDARMRLGKVIQAYEGGVSILDK